MPSTSNDIIYEFCAIFVTFSMIYAVSGVFGDVIRTFFMMLSLTMLVVISLPSLRSDLNKISFLYCLSITLGFVFHKILGLETAKLFGEALLRIVPVLVIAHYGHGRFYQNKHVRIFALAFFILECLLAIFEKLTLSHFVDYDSETQAMNVGMDFDEDFRAFSLMSHPLYNANVVSIFLAFILCSNTIRTIPKLILIFLGLGAIWAFNSRACMLMWMFILVYRLFFYGKSLKWMVFSVCVLLLLLPTVFIYAKNNGLLGRLDFDFSDGSTLTRIWAFQIFFEYPWSFREMIMGGTILYYPGVMLKNSLDYVALENGVLLDLGYWGFILGTIKIIGEIVITYTALYQFKIKDKLIIMMAMWGVAMMNNNSFNAFIMVFFMCSFLAFGLNQSCLGKYASR